MIIYRTGKIVCYNDKTGVGALFDYKYNEKIYKFKNLGFRAGQYVLYTTTNLNPITGYRGCDLIAPKLWSGAQIKYNDGDEII